MCSEKTSMEPSLFDHLIKELGYVTQKYQVIGGIDTSTIQPETLYAYHDSRTGREALHSAGRAIAIASLVPGLRKRYIGHTCDDIPTGEDRESAAVLEFLEDNARCREFNNSAFPYNLDGFCQEILGECRMLLADVLDSNTGSVLTLEAVAQNLATGPGSSSGVKNRIVDDKDDLRSSMYARLCEGPMSFGSPDVAGVYKACILTTRLMSVTEAIRYHLYGMSDSFYTPATFLSVPKTNLKNRGICTQPSGNMALQLSTHGILSDALMRRFDCNLEIQQEFNGRLAYLGSFGQRSMENHSWNFCTGDLSRASNFPWLLIQNMFPELWVNWLDLIRSHTMLVGGLPIKKEMCSSMGNGFTFSLMTMILSAIVKVLYKYADLPEYDVHPIWGKMKTWAVYGDDIIVDKSVVTALRKVLAAFGFLWNDKKSCVLGFFRESCGQDYFGGYPTRPVFVETLRTQTDIYSLLNRLVLWGVTHSVDLDPALQILRNALGRDVLRVPNWEDVSHGLHVPFSMCVHKPLDVPFVISALLNQGNVPYSTLMPKPCIRVLERYTSGKRYYSDVGSREKLSFDFTLVKKRYAKNLPGMLYCMLAGSVRNGTYGVRPSGSTSYKTCWRIAPGWGDPTQYRDIAFPLRWDVTLSVYGLWEEYVKRNLGKPKLHSGSKTLQLS